MTLSLDLQLRGHKVMVLPGLGRSMELSCKRDELDGQIDSRRSSLCEGPSWTYTECMNCRSWYLIYQMEFFESLAKRAVQHIKGFTLYVKLSLTLLEPKGLND
jgi:hypothetical protein